MQPVLHLFGHIKFERNGTSPALVLPAKAFVLLAMLVAHHDRRLAREWLAEKLWPDDDPAAARANLRRHLHLLAKALGEDVLELTRQTARWNDASDVDVDVLAFDRALEANREEDAVQLYRGEFCSGLSDELLDGLRDSYARRYVEALRSLCAKAQQRGDDMVLLTYLTQLRAHDAFDERSARELMIVRDRTGDRAGALREYSALTSRLKAELGVEPEPETVAVFERILADTSDSTVRTNLPERATSFIGRDHELQSLAFALRGTRVVTITGPGGVGKTRLAIEAASVQRRSFPGGVLFVDLVQARDAAEVMESVASACGVPAGLESAFAAVRAQLQEARTLLVLDNCEHVLNGVRECVESLLAETAAVILATSRRPIDIPQEHAVKIEPLPLPRLEASPDELLRSPSLRLFLERATRVSPDLRVKHENARSLAEIVRRLDGLPLALELVAARANLLTVDGISKRLRDALPTFKGNGRHSRHRTVLEAAAWSYELLSERERRVFELCSVFAGSFTLDALTAVLGEDDDGFEELSELVESSLVQTRFAGDTLRYTLLETTREFAGTQLSASSNVQRARAAHAHYYTAFVDRLSPFAEGAREIEYYSAIDDEYPNVRQALEFAVEFAPELAALMVAALYRYWTMRGRIGEGWQIARRLHDDERLRNLSAELRGRFLQAYGILARECGVHDAAAAAFAQALECYECTGDRRRQTEVVWAQAKLAYNEDDIAGARALYYRCLDLMEGADFEHMRAMTLANIGSISQSLGDLDEAERTYEAAVAECRRLGYLRGLAFVYRQLSLQRQWQGNFEASIELARQSVELSVELGESDREADTLVLLACNLCEAQRPHEALPPLVRALELVTRSQHAQFLMLAVQALARTLHDCGEYADSVRIHALAERIRIEKNLGLGDHYAREVEETIASLKARLPKERFDAAWLSGEGLSGDDALRIARQHLAAEQAAG